MVNVLFIIIATNYLYQGRLSDMGFWAMDWLLILLVPYIANEAWVEEEVDKIE